IPHLERLIHMGLGYLSLERQMHTLSGGEAQRVKIARHLGSSLNNIIYIFDEPTAGLHQEEISRLITMLTALKERHNTVLIIEHNPAIIEIADEIIEMGPGAGVDGGEVTFQGELSQLSSSSTSRVLEQKQIMNQHPRKHVGDFPIIDANHNNLKNITVNIPKHILVYLCGVSGSGKSSLMLEAFLKAYPETITVSQKTIGISSRSTLATYMGIMDKIRSIFAKVTGQPAGLFSFNSLGACPVCKGKGIITPDVAFADPVTTTCEACNGTRYSNEALSFQYKGKSIVDILKLTINETLEYFDQPTIVNKIATLQDVGLSYITLGQTTSSLSGGEIQRLKLASHLQKSGQIYVLDEPSLGLHTTDSEKLLTLFQRLVDQGNSVIIIEHRLDFIAASDWVIELGPGAGKDGGEVLFEGTPEEMVKANTLTAKWLRELVK